MTSFVFVLTEELAAYRPSQLLSIYQWIISMPLIKVAMHVSNCNLCSCPMQKKHDLRHCKNIVKLDNPVKFCEVGRGRKLLMPEIANIRKWNDVGGASGQGLRPTQQQKQGANGGMRHWENASCTIETTPLAPCCTPHTQLTQLDWYEMYYPTNCPLSVLQGTSKL